MMTELRKFDVGDIISVADGHLVARRHMDAVYDILQYMTGEDGLFTHQLLRAGEVCKPYLAEQHPDLASVVMPFFSGDRETDEKMLDQWLKQFGPPREVKPLPDGVWSHKDPIEEACDIVGADKVWVI